MTCPDATEIVVEVPITMETLILSCSPSMDTKASQVHAVPRSAGATCPCARLLACTVPCACLHACTHSLACTLPCACTYARTQVRIPPSSMHRPGTLRLFAPFVLHTTAKPKTWTRPCVRTAGLIAKQKLSL